jgi:hypothetical protein
MSEIPTESAIESLAKRIDPDAWNYGVAMAPMTRGRRKQWAIEQASKSLPVPPAIEG